MHFMWPLGSSLQFFVCTAVFLLQIPEIPIESLDESGIIIRVIIIVIIIMIWYNICSHNSKLVGGPGRSQTRFRDSIARRRDSGILGAQILRTEIAIHNYIGRTRHYQRVWLFFHRTPFPVEGNFSESKWKASGKQLCHQAKVVPPPAMPSRWQWPSQ